MEKYLLCSYTMTYDEGFAPNPYHGVLTLATCKPKIRSSKRIDQGVWLAGWAGRRLQQDKEKQRELIYLAKISEKISLGKYYVQYKQKRPKIIDLSYKENEKDEKGRYRAIKEYVRNHQEEIGDLMGDNIYKLNLENGNLEWQPNNNHPFDCAKHDIGGQYAIICHEFYYFGGEKGNHLYIPEEYNIRMPKRYTAYTEDSDEVKRFIDYVTSNSDKAIRKGNEYESNI